MAAQDYEQVTYNSAAGAQMGQSATEKIAFHGATPTDQYALVTAVSTSALVAVSGAYGFATEAQATALVSAVNSILAMAKEKGLIASA